MKVRRDELGRVLSKLDCEQWFYNDDTYWVDYKELDVRFPKHLEDMNGEVKVSYIEK